MGIPKYQVLTKIFCLKQFLDLENNSQTKIFHENITLHCLCNGSHCLFILSLISEKSNCEIYLKYSHLKIGIDISLKEPYEREREIIQTLLYLWNEGEI